MSAQVNQSEIKCCTKYNDCVDICIRLYERIRYMYVCMYLYIYRNKCNIERENCSSLLGAVNLEREAFECEEDERTYYRVWRYIGFGSR